MSAWITVSMLALWVAVIVLTVMNVVLYRQLGIMVMGSARGLEESGLPIGRRVPAGPFPQLDGNDWAPAEQLAPYLLFFAGTYCTDCKEMLPFIREARRAGLPVVTMLFNDGPDTSRRYVAESGLDGVVVSTTQEVGHLFDVIAVPYAYLVDETGVIREKGLLRSRERVVQMAAVAGVALPPPAQAVASALVPHDDSTELLGPVRIHN